MVTHCPRWRRRKADRRAEETAAALGAAKAALAVAKALPEPFVGEGRRQWPSVDVECEDGDAADTSRPAPAGGAVVMGAVAADRLTQASGVPE